MLLLSSNHCSFQFNGNNIRARYGPDSLDASLFLADLLLMYNKQTGVLEHGVQYKTVDTAQKFGKSLQFYELESLREVVGWSLCGFGY